MANFLENLRGTYRQLADNAATQPSKDAPVYDSNKIIDFFQYANEGTPEDVARFQENNRADLKYTPFAWSEDRRGGHSSNSLSGLVISGPSPTGEGARILGVQLDNGSSLSASGAKKFFNDMKQRGSFRFADQTQLWNNKTAGDWPLQPGNPFEFVNKRENVDQSGLKTFEAGRGAGYQELGEARKFLNNIRGTNRL